MSEKREIAGVWWLPENPDDCWAGLLTFQNGTPPTLKVTAQKNVFSFLGKNPSAPAVIHGRDQNNKPISLLMPGWPRTSGGMALSQIEYSAHYAILNLEVSNSNDFKVNELSLRLQYLQGWLGISGFLDLETSSPDADICIRYKNPNDLSFSISEDLMIKFRPGYSFRNGLNEKKLEENVDMTFFSKSGINLAQFKEFLNDIRLLLHFATLEKNYPLSIKAKKDGHGFTLEGKFYPQDIEIWNSIIKDDTSTNLLLNDWIFKFADVGKNFSEFFQKWTRLTGDYEEAISCYSAAIYHLLPSAIEHICLTQALEAFHGVKFASHEKRNFSGKIQELANIYKDHLKGLVDDTADFAETVRDNRHYYTHHNPEDLKAGRVVKGSKLIRLNEKLKLIFQMCMLTEMGIPSDRFPRLRRQLASAILDFE